MNNYWIAFEQIIATPFEHAALIWGIVPLYFGLLLNELTSDKANYRTAVQTGFSFIWAAAHWLYPYFQSGIGSRPWVELGPMLPVQFVVTFLVLAFGVLALYSGIARRYPKYCRFLGHTRFANYFMITIFPMQARALEWTWDRWIALAIFAVPVWVALHFGFMPLRK